MKTRDRRQAHPYIRVGTSSGRLTYRNKIVVKQQLFLKTFNVWNERGNRLMVYLIDLIDLIKIDALI